MNLKACLFAISRYFDETGQRVPVMVSGTFDPSGATFVSGQVIEAFWNAISHFPLLSVGMNCALGPDVMRPHIEELSKLATSCISCHPNAGIPNEMGDFDLQPAEMAKTIGEWAEAGWLNIVGGCCGTTPEHIAAIADVVAGVTPHKENKIKPLTRLSGSRPLTLREDANFMMVGERTNVTGSRKFARLIREEHFEDAVEVARDQVEGGAAVIDVNMDDALLDGEAAMTKFLRLIAGESDISAVPVMIDSSKWSVIEAGLKCGARANRSSIRSASRTAKQNVISAKCKDWSAVTGRRPWSWPSTSTGQATEVDHKLTDLLRRAYEICSHDRVGFPRRRTLYSTPTSLTVATGMERTRQLRR